MTCHAHADLSRWIVILTANNHSHYYSPSPRCTRELSRTRTTPNRKKCRFPCTRKDFQSLSKHVDGATISRCSPTQRVSSEFSSIRILAYGSTTWCIKPRLTTETQKRTRHAIREIIDSRISVCMSMWISRQRVCSLRPILSVYFPSKISMCERIVQYTI